MRTMVAMTLAVAVASWACVPDGPSRLTGSEPFTDADLRAARQASPRLVVYVWSPHMPLSVDGYAEVAAAAGTFDAIVVPVLFAGSDPAFARREADRVGMPRGALREMASRTLARREGQLHAPSIVVFQDAGVAPVLPGYRNAEGYRRYLESVLDAP